MTRLQEFRTHHAVTIAESYQRAGAHNWKIPESQWAAAIHRAVTLTGIRSWSARSQSAVAEIVRSLYAEDLAFALAFRLGCSDAMGRFLTDYRALVLEMSVGGTGERDANYVADEIFWSLYGQELEDGSRQSLFREFDGRVSLASWLGSVIEERTTGGSTTKADSAAGCPSRLVLSTYASRVRPGWRPNPKLPLRFERRHQIRRHLRHCAACQKRLLTIEDEVVGDEANGWFRGDLRARLLFVGVIAVVAFLTWAIGASRRRSDPLAQAPGAAPDLVTDLSDGSHKTAGASIGSEYSPEGEEPSLFETDQSEEREVIAELTDGRKARLAVAPVNPQTPLTSSRPGDATLASNRAPQSSPVAPLPLVAIEPQSGKAGSHSEAVQFRTARHAGPGPELHARAMSETRQRMKVLTFPEGIQIPRTGPLTAAVPTAGSAEVRLFGRDDGLIKPIIVRSKGNLTQWRLTSGGVIGRSDDETNWQPLYSGTASDLAAGAAPSAGVCWIVGRNGTILRTTDGEQWQTLASPTGGDLVSVTASDENSATLVAADGRRFETSDGGESWLLITTLTSSDGSVQFIPAKGSQSHTLHEPVRRLHVAGRPR